MSQIDVLRIAIRMLRVNWFRSLLTVLGIGIAISLIVSLIGLGYGLQNVTIGSIVQSKSLLSLDVTSNTTASDLNGANVGVLSHETVEEIKQLNGIQAVEPVINTNGELKVNSKLASVSITAADPTFFDMEGISVKEGVMYTPDSHQVVISPQILELLDQTPESVLGQTVEFSYTDPDNENQSEKAEALTIVGMSDVADAPILFTPYQLIDPEKEAKITLIKALAKDREAVFAVRDALVVKGYHVESLIETLDQARTVFNWVTIGLSVLGIIALLVASIGMFNTLTIALIERTREIGIMKAIGITNKTVRQLFLAEASILGFLGGLSGLLFALFINSLLEVAFNQAARIYEGSTLPLFQYPPGFLIAILLFPTLLSIATGIYPANRAAKINPLNALRFE